MKRLDLILQHIRVCRVRGFIAAGARVLDIGCADGVLHREIPSLGFYVGIDPDASPATLLENGRFIRDTFPTPELGAAEHFDVITAMAVLEHVSRDAQPAFARACAEHIVPGGRLLITVPSPVVDSIIDVLKRASVLDGMKDEQHYGFDPETTPSLFEPYGFRLEAHSCFELGLNHLFVFRRNPV
jgi:2-polyprenyl-3-methyl-5-hydroxy-6-metoxy-1,4-benzoquinol methylase